MAREGGGGGGVSAGMGANDHLHEGAMKTPYAQDRRNKYGAVLECDSGNAFGRLRWPGFA